MKSHLITKLMYSLVSCIAILSNASAGSRYIEEAEERKSARQRTAVVYTGKGINAKAAAALLEKIREHISPASVLEITDSSYLKSFLASKDTGDTCFVVPGGNTFELVMSLGREKDV